jgi:pimeloyl-ACP methyl ester carboxylesterase
MAALKLVLLPGLHGTSALFEPFVKRLPDSVAPAPIDYPGDRFLNYESLTELVLGQVRDAGPFAVLGESFSGPVAVRVAAARPAGLKAVILVVSFASDPVALPLRLAARAAPDWLLGRVMRWNTLLRSVVGPSVPRETLDKLVAELRRARPEVLSRRLRHALACDVTNLVGECHVPMLYLRAARDRLVRGACGEAIARLQPSARLVTLDSPHLLLQTRPEAAAREITSFLEDVAAAPRLP